MNKKVILASAAGAAILVSAVAVTTVYASSLGRGRNYTPERHEQMTKAFADKDYDAWRKAMGDRPMVSRINEGNFSKFSEMHKFMQEGKYEDASKIRQELGLGNGRGGRAMMGGQRGQGKGGNFVDQNNDGICDHMQSR